MDYAQYDHDGYWIAREVFAAAEIGAIAAAFTELGVDGPVAGLSDVNVSAAHAHDPLLRWPRMMNPHRHVNYTAGRLALQYMLDARLIDTLRALLGDEPLAAQSMFYFKPPGARGQALHQDNFYLRVRPGTCMAAWIAVDDSKPDNGGLHVVPRTQHLEVACPAAADLEKSFVANFVAPPPGHAAVPALLEPGDVLFFNGSVIHGSEPNVSSRFRRSLIFHYVPESCVEVADWYRPLLRAGGTVVERQVASSGGPCGDVALAAEPH